MPLKPGVTPQTLAEAWSLYCGERHSALGTQPGADAICMPSNEAEVASLLHFVNAHLRSPARCVCGGGGGWEGKRGMEEESTCVGICVLSQGKYERFILCVAAV